MTMRQHKRTRNLDRAMPTHLSKQQAVMIAGIGKLLGLGADVDTIMSKIVKRHDAIKPPVKVEKVEKTAFDYIRMAKAEARRQRQRATRLECSR